MEQGTLILAYRHLWKQMSPFAERKATKSGVTVSLIPSESQCSSVVWGAGDFDRALLVEAGIWEGLPARKCIGIAWWRALVANEASLTSGRTR